MTVNDRLPDRVESEEQLEELLSRPTAELFDLLSRLPGDLLILGAGGKMGLSLARMARRASGGSSRRVIAVSRFANPAVRGRFLAHGVETIACDLLSPGALASLPDAPWVVFMTGVKFGTTDNPSLTWAMNTLLPGLVTERYAGSRIVAFSTGNVYALTRPERGGARETDPPAPIGEYGMSALGRERLFEYGCRRHGIPTAIVRLNYAHDLRYGVMVDLAQKVLAEKAIELAMGWFNAIWQGDACAQALRCLEQAAVPPMVVNVAGPEVLSVRETAEKLGKLLGRTPRFAGQEAGDALLSNTDLARRLFGPPAVSADRLIRWVADWTKHGRPTLNRPTHFEVRDGGF